MKWALIGTCFAMGFNFASAVLFLWRSRGFHLARLRVEDDFRNKSIPFIQNAVAELAKLPEWAAAANVAEFLIGVSRDETLPDDVREAAKRLLPMQDMQFSVETVTRPRVH